MSATDDLLTNHATYAALFASGRLEIPPARPVAIVTCMDARLDPARMLGLELGDAHVIRNAGGIVTEDVLRSLALSQFLLGTHEIVLMHHTNCGMTMFKDDEVADQIRTATGTRPPSPLGSFPDSDDDVRASMARVRECSYLKSTDSVRGFVYQVEDGGIREVF